MASPLLACSGMAVTQAAKLVDSSLRPILLGTRLHDPAVIVISLPRGVPMLPLSVLDLAQVPNGGSPVDAFRRSLALAQYAERWGYHRFWLAEHHNMVGIASAATAVVIAFVAAGTRTLRVGSGGIMLPNHAPLIIAEQFGTLESLYPGRIDLGLGRAPGTDQQTLRALRRDPADADRFPQDVLELQRLLGPLQPGQTVQAVPGTNLNVPIWILGSSLFGAQLAGVLGLPYAFAAHFSPDALLPALATYRSTFRPSAQLERPYAMVAVNVIAADDEIQARQRFTSVQQSFTNMVRGTRGRLPAPIDDIESYWSPPEKARVSHMLSRSFVGSPATIGPQLDRFVEETGIDELMVASAIYDNTARLRSYEILAAIGVRESKQMAVNEVTTSAYRDTATS
jgi:luciferase family oxidoreductase group 1